MGVRGDRVAVLACDADVHAVTRVTGAEQVTLAGGGGTDLRVGIPAALALPDRPDVVVVLTDGFTPWPAESPACRLIAALLGEGAPAPPGWVETLRVTF
ncbi:VWA-like domain-containing protein [Streptomyces sp. NPDC048255]|uniref:VWA-like domain-containing protein n=1 Tax=Streptomyces sp. NPDC048255 TaxID=3154713 RepID=UPI00340C562E